MSLHTIRLLAVSGSLRANSSNKELLRAAVALCPPGIDMLIYEGLGALPHFNPDHDGEEAEPSVTGWRAILRSCDGVVFSVPEYAHGVPGSLKNALDWVVGGTEFVGKPVTLFNASPRGTYAQASLLETLTVMSANVVSEASVTLNPSAKPFSADEILANPELSALLRSAIESFAAAIRASKDAE